MSAHRTSCHCHRRGQRHWQGQRAGPAARRVLRRACRTTRRGAAANGRGIRRGRASAGGSHRRERSRVGACAVRRHAGKVRATRRVVQQRRHRRAGGAAGRPDRRAVAESRRRQPDRPLPVYAGSLSVDEEPESHGRADHQQRLDLGRRAAAALSALHGHQARHHRADQEHVAGRPKVQHRLRTDRHRQCPDRHDQAAGRRCAYSRTGRSRSSRRWTPTTSPTWSCTWPTCRWKPTCNS